MPGVRWRTIGAATAAGALFAAPPASAALSCTIGATAIAFGNYNGVAKAQVTTTGTITLTCTGSGSTTYTVTVSPGASGTATARYMTSGANRLNYQLYKDAAFTQVLGDGNGGTYTFSNTTSSGSRSGTVYGLIAAGQAAEPGSYGDTVTVTVTY